MDESDFQRRCGDFVAREVHYGVSALVHSLAKQYGADLPSDLADIAEEAFELCQPTVDRSARVEALEQAGLKLVEIAEGRPIAAPWWFAADEHDPAPEPGWYAHEGARLVCGPCDTAEEAAEEAIESEGLEDSARECAGEIYEHWIVSDWLAARLRDRGHTVGEMSGLTIWGRPTTGQAISMDGVIRDIVRDGMVEG